MSDEFLKITLIENYRPDAQQSMLKFGELLFESLTNRGHNVERQTPLVIFGASFLKRFKKLQKWLGYIDKYLIFPFILKRYAQQNTDRIFHIVDHSNAVYEGTLKGSPLILTCHDVMAISSALGEVPQNLTGWSGKVLQKWILSHLRNVKNIVCDSEKTRSDLLRHCKRESSEFVDVIHIALNGDFKPLPEQEVDDFLAVQFGQKINYFFHVGGNQWYKNRKGIVELFLELRKQKEFSSHHLVLAGKPCPEDLKIFIEHSGFSHVIHMCVDLSHGDLLKFYNGAEALLFTSLAEGYGWPILEAQACGTWVITSDREPMTEVGGAGAIYVDPKNLQKSATLIAQEFVRKNELIWLGQQNVDKFDRQTMMDRYDSAYRKAK